MKKMMLAAAMAFGCGLAAFGAVIDASGKVWKK